MSGPQVPAGLPSDQVRTSTGVRRVINPVTSNLSRSTATSTASLDSTSGSESRTSGSTVPSQRRSPSVLGPSDVLNPHSDNLKVGDKVFVNGTKEGAIRFLGTTTFAPGRWAGVELSDESGKNDGSVNSVRYFECEPNHGLFVRPYRLTVEKMTEEALAALRPSSSRAPSPTGSTRSGISVTSSAVSRRSQSRNEPFMKVQKSSSGATVCGNLRVGCRVIVNASSGSKVGTLRYLGPADFAPGAWAGIELDYSSGKNDGSVAGKRYFSCPMNFGLFAPINKVSRESSLNPVPMTKTGLQPTLTSTRTPSSLSRIPSNLRKGKSGSQESISSITSSVSMKSNSGSRIKLGVTSLKSSPDKSGTNGAKAASGTTKAGQLASVVGTASAALHEAISEKEEHISQLLQERDLERGEVARAVAAREEMEEKLNQIMTRNVTLLAEKDEQIAHLQSLLDEDVLVQTELQEQLDETRKTLEIMEFKLQEEACLKEERSATEGEKEREKEREKEGGESSRKGKKSPMKMDEDPNEEELFQLQEEVLRKDERIFELEQLLESRKTEVSNLCKRIKEFETQVGSFDERTKKYLETIDELNLRVKKLEDQKSRLENERESFEGIKKKLSDQVSELETKIRSTSSAEKEQLTSVIQEQKEQLTKQKEELTKQKEQLTSVIQEQKEQLTSVIQEQKSQLELLRTSNGKLSKEVDDTKSQFKRLENNLQSELREKERRIEDLLISENQLRVEVSRREEAISKLELTIENLHSSCGDSSDQLKGMNAELKKRSLEVKRLEEEVMKLRSQIDRMDVDREKSTESLDLLKKDQALKERQMNQLLEEVKSAEERIKVLEDDLTKSRNEREMLLKSKEEEVEKLNSKINHLLKQSGDSGLELSKMNQELSNQVKAREDLEISLRKLRDELSRAEKENFSLESKLSESKNILQVKEGKISEFSEKILELESSLRGVNEEKKRIQVDLEATIRRQDESSIVLDKLNEENREKQTSIKKLKEQVKSLSESLTKEEKEKEVSVKKLKEQVKSLSENLTKEEKEKRRLSDELVDIRKRFTDRDKSLDQLSKKLHETESELLRQMDVLKEERNELIMTKDRLTRELAVSSSATADRDLMIKSLKDQLEKSRQDFDRHRRELQEQLLITRKDGHEIVDDLRMDLRKRDDEINTLTTTNENLRSQVDSLSGQVEDLRVSASELVSRIESSSELVSSLESRIEESESVIEAKQSLIERLEKEHETSVENYKKRLCQEKHLLLEKISEMETVLAENKKRQGELLDQVNESMALAKASPPRSPSAVTTTTSIAINSRNTSTSVTSSSTHSLGAPNSLNAPNPVATSSDQSTQFQEQIDGLEQQIEFLNSVIVDMQRKNDELKSKVQILEEFGDVGPEFDETAQELIQKINANGTRTRAPRLFCDICDCFDLHDTEDCPQQSAGMESMVTSSLHVKTGHLATNGHSKHRGSRHEERSYCSNCQVFGHWTQDCDLQVQNSY